MDEFNPFEDQDLRTLTAEQTLRAFTDATDNEDWSAACGQLTNRAIGEMAGTSAQEVNCESLIAVRLEGVAGPSGPIEVDSTEERGNDLLVTLTEGSEVLMSGSGDKIASFDPNG